MSDDAHYGKVRELRRKEPNFTRIGRSTQKSWTLVNRRSLSPDSTELNPRIRQLK